jgi:hypothetical protein
MRVTSALIIVLAAVTQSQAQQHTQQYRGMTLGERCAQASAHIKNNDCGPVGCDEGLCIALQHGCHINGWGHVCPRMQERKKNESRT